MSLTERRTGGLDLVPTVGVVVVAYGAEPGLARCVSCILASEGVDVDVIVVDNGCTDQSVSDAADAQPRVSLVRADRNLGFAGGANLGAQRARGEYLFFINSDAYVDRGALRAMVEVLSDSSVGLVTPSLRLAEQPAVLNSAGNPWHLTGLVWAGHHGEPADRFHNASEVATVTGAAFGARRETWERLGGFGSEWFMYGEDADLSMRTWQQGLRVVYAPDAVVLHDYEFGRNPDKQYLLERNRLLNVLTLYERRTLLLLGPVLVAVECAIWMIAVGQHWTAAKLRGYLWLWQHRAYVLGRRRAVQSQRKVSDATLSRFFSDVIEPSNVGLPRPAWTANVVIRAYWRLIRRFV